MEVKVAKSAGFCFGVKRAVKLVYDEAASNPGRVFTMGPIIHNDQVVDDLRSRGVRIINDDLVCGETGDMPGPGDTVILRSHGVSREMADRVRALGCRTVDATCPFVSKIHSIVDTKSREGYHIVIVGNPDHPEVCGIRGWVNGPCTVIASAEEAERVSFPSGTNLWMVSQTTFNLENFNKIVEIVGKKGYSVIVTNTICNATKERQAESFELARESDVMIVIGGKHSSNTQKLFDICKGQCNNTYYIQKLDDLVTVDIQSDSCVGITAGASTPNNIIMEVSTHVRRSKL